MSEKPLDNLEINEEWQNCYEKTSRLDLEIQNLLDEMIDDEQIQLGYFRMQRDFIEKLISMGETTSTLGNYLTYHILIGSTPNPIKHTGTDLTGDRSIIAQMERYLEKLRTYYGTKKMHPQNDDEKE